MSNLKEIRERFYFSYSKPESDFLKGKGMFYLTKAIHPQTLICFTMWDQSPALSAALIEYKNLKGVKVGN